jgi:hypothetical protein
VNINKFKPYQLEVTIKGGGEHKEDSKNKKESKHKEDSKEDFQDDFIENQTKFKTIVNEKDSVVDIKKSIYKTIELEVSFSSMDFSRDPSKSWNSTKRNFFNKTIGNFSSRINSNLESTRNNFSVEYPIEDSTPKLAWVDLNFFNLELVGVDSNFFNLESIETDFNMESTQEDFEKENGSDSF